MRSNIRSICRSSLIPGIKVPGAKSLCHSDKSVKYEHAASILDMHQNINNVISSEITSDLKNPRHVTD